MFKPTVGSASDAASLLFNLPDHRVVPVTRDAGVPVVRGGERHGSSTHDAAGTHVPFDGLVTVWWVKKRWRCTEPLCGRATVTEYADQVPPYARLTTRLKARIVTALAGEVR